MDDSPLLQRKFLSPKYWPAWAGISLLFLLAWLPGRLRLYLGRGLGLLGYFLAHNRRYIAEVTTKSCFPELDQTGHQRLVRSCFMENGVGLVESASVWVRGAGILRRRHQITGVDAAISAMNQGQGVLILVPHYSSMDYIGAILSLYLPYLVTYRPNNNALLNAFIQKGRRRYCATVDRNNLRVMVRELKQGRAVWYAPDQDFARPELTVFAPFFGKAAATLTSAGKLAHMTDAATFCLNHHRDEHNGRHELSLVPLDESWPSGDVLADATVMNKYFEDAIRYSPSQYMWMHKRFKTQPGGKPDSPYIHSSTFCKDITPKLYGVLVAGSELEKGHEQLLQSGKIAVLANGLYIKLFQGVPGPLRLHRHPALRFDRMAKEIRSRGIKSVTPDNIFKARHLNITGVTYHPLEGIKLKNMIASSIGNDTLQTVAAFLTRAHETGVLPDRSALPSMFVSDTDCSISNPLGVRLFPCSLCYADRVDNLSMLASELKLNEIQKQVLGDCYAKMSGLEGNRLYELELNRAFPSVSLQRPEH